MPGAKTEQPELSEFEKQRAANIAERDALLQKLSLEAQSAGLLVKGPTSTRKRPASDKKKPPAKRVKNENRDAPVPRRTSARLAGLTADSEITHRRAEAAYEAEKRALEEKKKRVAGDLNLGDIMVKGEKWDSANLRSLIGSGPARPYDRTFGDEDIKKTADKDLRTMREKMSGLKLWEGWEPGQIKITPERIYTMTFHPTESKPLIFAGDKIGNLGIFDASQEPPAAVDEENTPDPVITTIKPHSRTISSMHIHPSIPTKLYSASYDGSIRELDLENSIAVESYAPRSSKDEEPLSCMDISPEHPHILYFTTLVGTLGRHDTRVNATVGRRPNADQWELSEKKIGGFSICPTRPQYISTASLDRTLKVWDIRNLPKQKPIAVGEHQSSKSVSHAAFNSAGQIATSSYDDTVKIYNFGALDLYTRARDKILDMDPDKVVRHNCQTGRWVTILRPHWQAAPQSPTQRFCIGNMNRFVDVYTSKGEQLAQLGGNGLITAVPAVAVFHRSQDWVVGGTASGKVCLWT